uniref:Beta-lactamase n=2 Tax=Gloeothece TaxID=28070 RepID=E0UHR7_GLOV7|nr:beta-lactamase [Gloeothece verrucosa PCC 7822]
MENYRSEKKEKLKARRQNSGIVIRAVSNVSDAESPQTQATSDMIVPMRRGERDYKNRSRDKRSSPVVMNSIFYLLRMMILGVGLSAIAGTVLTVFDPTIISEFVTSKLNLPQLLPAKSTAKKAVLASQPKPTPQPSPHSSPAAFSLTQEIAPLKKKLMDLVPKYPKLEARAFFVDMDNGNYVDINAQAPIPAASTIKIFVLVALLEQIDAGKVRLDEQLTMTKDIVTSGSGDMQYQPVGKKFTVLETATKMIIISDNTATDMLVKRLGGKQVLNQRFREWGLTNTIINNILPDLEGTNTTSPRDLAYILMRVNQGELLSLKSRDRMLNIMQQTKTRTLLPQGLDSDAIIAHKTGDIGTVLGDAGIIDMPNGKRYIGAVMVKRPYNDTAGRMMIQEISRTVYQHLKWSSASQFLKPEAPQASPVASPQASPVASPQASPVASPQASPVASPQASPTQRTQAAPAAPAASPINP